MYRVPEAKFITILFLVLTAIPNYILAGETPKIIEGATTVTAEDLIALVDSTPNVVLVDSRIRGDRKQGFVEGSISLPDIDTNCTTLAKNIASKESSVLFYCNGIKCGRSANAIAIAITCGYHNTYWFRGGFDEWQTKGYPFLRE